MEEVALVAMHQARLSEFVLRARRIAAHSLAEDFDGLVALAKGTFRVVSDGSKTYVEYTLPPEEILESAAARVRPLLLRDEDCHYLKALAALGYFLRDSPLAGDVKMIRKTWRDRLEESPAASPDEGYTLMVADTHSGEEAHLDHLRLALAWIYGDVVHHDSERRAEGRAFGVGERFQAAVPLVAFIMLHAIRLLHMIEMLHARGLVPLSEDALSEDIVMGETTIRKEVSVHFAPVGTAPPDSARSPFGPGWSRMDPSMPPALPHAEEQTEGP